GLAFRFDTQGVVPEVVRADEKRVRQILINLLGNGIKFTARGQVVFRVRYAREMAQFEVEDTGPGLAADELAQIFEPFARGNSAAHSAPGAGLGLTMAKMLTDLMGGELTATSTPGVGSVFRVRLFLPEVHAAAVAKPQAVQQRRGYEGARRRILVVDNEEADRDVLVHLLEPLGFELRTAASGHDALDLLAAGLQPDAILMDLAMPGIDGWETIRRLRRLGHVGASPGDGPPLGGTAPSGGRALHAVKSVGAKIAIVSANAFDKGLENDVGIPSEDFILKPLRHTELLDWLERQLGLRWLEAPPPAVVPLPQPGAGRRPDAAALEALQQVVQLGYYRGILNKLDEIDAAQPECAPFTAGLRELARQFQFEAIARRLADGGALEEAAS
ncbi:MAG: response regulator, partial [Comamonadaceae bacterium]